MRVLAGDIGGTKTSLAIFEVNGTNLEAVAEEKYLSGDYTSLDEIVQKFIAVQKDIPEWASFGIAGPVRDGIAKTMNLPWIVDAQKMADEIGFKKVWLMNDLEANAWGIGALQEEDFFILNEGKSDSNGNASIISAGTGLGQAGLFNNGKELHPFASEGGHSDFSPNTDLEIALLQFLKKRYAKESHVSWERLVSGMGIGNIYDFLCDYRGSETPDWLAEEIRTGDKAASISKAADESRCPICAETFKLFVHLYGAEAGNHALKIMATAGVYIGGGIAAKNIEQFRNSTFMDSFCAKGRMKQIMQDIPVKIILNQRTALYGPAIFAGTKI
ncbi:MAG: glucokinase [Campylobacterota bacterium]|nr:glucokinase [Campylobacterota bacterium]